MPTTKPEWMALAQVQRFHAEQNMNDAHTPLHDPLLSVVVTEPAVGVRVVHAAGELDLTTTNLLRRRLRDLLALGY